MTQKILYVEDNPSNVVVVQRVAQALGYDLVLAENGQSGLDMAHEIMPDMILMDIGLPDIDGLEVTRKLRENKDTARLPIVAVTAHALNGDREKCLEAGCDEYLAKPFTVASLKGIFERFLAKQKEQM
jgi:two-component system, cell cycle response regulator DivK